MQPPFHYLREPLGVDCIGAYALSRFAHRLRFPPAAAPMLARLREHIVADPWAVAYYLSSPGDVSQ